MAIAYAGIEVGLREVVLKDKPAAMLAASSKGTVPVLIEANGRVIDESLDVMAWALDQKIRITGYRVKVCRTHLLIAVTIHLSIGWIAINTQ